MVSGSNGEYTALFLLSGDYEIAARLQGFKDAIRKGVHIGAGDHPIIDIRLDVGDAAQSVEVTADAPLVNNENASLGQTITTKEVEDFPLNGRSPMMLAQLAMGVIVSPFNSTSTVVQPYDSSNNFSIGGTPTQSSEMLVNGAPNATWDMRSAYSPPQDAVQEVRVKLLDTDAGFGHTRGGTINQVLRSGTNSLHGSLYEFNQPSLLTANSFFNNRNGLGNPVTHFNQYGATVGGPVFIPKLFNGKNKLFLFFAWENDKNSQPTTNFHQRSHGRRKAGRFFADPGRRRDSALRSLQRRANGQHHQPDAASRQPDPRQPDQSDRSKVSAVLSGPECYRDFHHHTARRLRQLRHHRPRHQ